MATQTRVPTSDVNTTLLAGYNTGSAYWSNIDEGVASHDSDTSYIYKTNINAWNNQFGHAAFDIAASSVNKVTAKIVGKRTLAGTQWIWGPRVKVNGSLYTGTNQQDNSGNYVTFTNDWLTNPNTSAAWTEADVEGTSASPLQEIIVSVSHSGTGTIYVTAAELVVDYEAVSSGPSVAVLMDGYRQRRQ